MWISKCNGLWKMSLTWSVNPSFHGSRRLFYQLRSQMFVLHEKNRTRIPLRELICLNITLRWQTLQYYLRRMQIRNWTTFDSKKTTSSCRSNTSERTTTEITAGYCQRNLEFITVVVTRCPNALRRQVLCSYDMDIFCTNSRGCE